MRRCSTSRTCPADSERCSGGWSCCRQRAPKSSSLSPAGNVAGTLRNSCGCRCKAPGTVLKVFHLTVSPLPPSFLPSFLSSNGPESRKSSRGDVLTASVEEHAACTASQADLSALQHFFCSLQHSESPQRSSTSTQSQCIHHPSIFCLPIYPGTCVSTFIHPSIHPSPLCVAPSASSSDAEGQRGPTSRCPAWQDAPSGREASEAPDSPSEHSETLTSCTPVASFSLSKPHQK